MGRRILGIILVILALLLVVAIPLALFTPQGARLLSSFSPAPTPTPKPVLTVQGTPPAVKATAAYLIDADTGNVLVNIQGQKRLPMASTTKIMTALIALERGGDLDREVVVQQDAVDEVKKFDGSTAQLVVGDKLRLIDLLYGLMLPSGDDAAIAIAQAVAGTNENFVKLMNDKAKALKLTQTLFVNVHGLTYKTKDGKPNPNYSSAADLTQLTRYAMRNTFFAQMAQLQRYVVPATSTNHAYTWETTNKLLSLYPGTTGVKTGFTGEAGYCLVFAATDREHHLVGTVMNEETEDDRYADASKLLEWGFDLPVLPPKPTPQV